MKWVTKIVLEIFTVFDERCNLQEIYEIRCMTLRGHLQDPRQGNPRLFKSFISLQVQQGYQDARSRQRSAKKAERSEILLVMIIECFLPHQLCRTFYEKKEYRYYLTGGSSN